jgi:hypothetical protein
LVTDEFAPMWWTLADAEGNEVDVCTWLARDRRAWAPWVAKPSKLATEPALIAKPITKLGEPQPAKQLRDSPSTRCAATPLDPNAKTNACAEEADST